MEIRLHEPVEKSQRESLSRRVAAIHVQSIAARLEEAEIPDSQKLYLIRRLRETEIRTQKQPDE